MSTTVLGESFNPSARKANLTDAVRHPSRTLTQHAVSGDTPKAPATSGRPSCSIITSLELKLLLLSSIVTLVGRLCTLTITHLSSASTPPPPTIFSLHRSKSSVVVPVLGVNAIPVQIEETVSTSFPLGKALFTSW